MPYAPVSPTEFTGVKSAVQSGASAGYTPPTYAPVGTRSNPITNINSAMQFMATGQVPPQVQQTPNYVANVPTMPSNLLTSQAQQPTYGAGISVYKVPTSHQQSIQQAPAQQQVNQILDSVQQAGGATHSFNTTPGGPREIPAGTPGTYISGGGRVLPEYYKPIAAAQEAYARGAVGGQDMQTFMSNLGFANPAPGGLIAGLPSEGWNWNTMSTPAMDEASGKVNVPISKLVANLPKVNTLQLTDEANQSMNALSQSYNNYQVAWPDNPESDPGIQAALKATGLTLEEAQRQFANANALVGNALFNQTNQYYTPEQQLERTGKTPSQLSPGARTYEEVVAARGYDSTLGQVLWGQ